MARLQCVFFFYHNKEKKIKAKAGHVQERPLSLSLQMNLRKQLPIRPGIDSARLGLEACTRGEKGHKHALGVHA